MSAGWLFLIVSVVGCGRPSPSPVQPSAAKAATTTNAAMQSLFVVGTTFRFRLEDEVDTHDPEEKEPKRTTVDLQLRVARTKQIGGALVSEIDWGLPEGWEWVTPPRLWALRDGAVWTLDGTFAPSESMPDAGFASLDLNSSDDDMKPILAVAPPVLSAERARAIAEHDHCAERRDEGSYGPVLQRLCFDASGLAEWSETNAHGPRVLRIRRATY